MPLISIIIPVYNVERYLRTCLDSVLAQTFADWECVVVDDGSPDGCPAICDEYAARDGRFRVIHQENGGLSAARNAGIRAAKGGYIALLDSDDMLADDNALRGLSGAIETTGAPVIFNAHLTTVTGDVYTRYDGFDRKFVCGTPAEFYATPRRDYNILLAAWGFCVSREFLLRENLFFKPGIFHEDEQWMPRVICAAGRIGVNHAPFYVYRREREGSIMATVTPKRLFDTLAILDELWRARRKMTGQQKQYRSIYQDRCLRLWFGVLYWMFFLEKQYSDERALIEKKLRKTAYLLLYGKKPKYIVRFLLVVFFGPVFCRNIMEFLKGVMKKWIK